MFTSEALELQTEANRLRPIVDRILGRTRRILDANELVVLHREGEIEAVGEYEPDASKDVGREHGLRGRTSAREPGVADAGTDERTDAATGVEVVGEFNQCRAGGEVDGRSPANEAARVQIEAETEAFVELGGGGEANHAAVIAAARVIFAEFQFEGVGLSCNSSQRQEEEGT